MYYGIPVNQDYGLKEIEFLWSRRNIDSYVDLKIDNIEKTLWRNCRTGVITQWNDSMISDTAKLGKEVIDEYVEISRLPIAIQYKLAMEQVNKLQNNIVDIANSLMSGKNGKKKLNKVPEIASQLLSESKIYPTLPIGDLIGNAIAKLLEVVEESEINSLLSMLDQSRFNQLNNIAKSSKWEDNCLLLTEIAEKKLFRFTHTSFDEYCKDINITSGSRKVKVGKLIKRFRSADLPLPSNRGQAEIVAEIPIENQIVVWTTLLSLDKKITSSLIRDVHKQILNKQVSQPQLQNSLMLRKKIEFMLANHGLSLDKNIKVFLNSVKNEANPVEVRMLRAILTELKKQAEKQHYVLASTKTPVEYSQTWTLPLLLVGKIAQSKSDQNLVVC